MKTIQFPVAITVDVDATNALVELLAQALNRATGNLPADGDDRRQARVLAARNAVFAGQKPPTDQGLLLNTRETAKLLKVSERTVYGMGKDGRMPPPIRIGGAVRWSYPALQKWVENGCPSQRPDG